MIRFSAVSKSLLALLAITTGARIVSGAAISERLIDDGGDAILEKMERLEKRGGACGWYGTLTCGENQYCYTDSSNGWALCGYTTATAAAATGASVSYNVYTTTYVETDLHTVTSTWSVAVATATSTCKASLGETACGSTCCGVGEFCVSGENYCAGTGGGSSAAYSSFFTFTSTENPSAPARGTTVVGVTVTATGSATTTVPYGTPVTTGGSTVGITTGQQNHGLSGGAIAGIVIGVIAGLLLLLLFCLCCCAKGAIDGILALLGLGGRSKRRTEETYIEERHSHRSGGAGRTWWGARPSRTSVVEERRKTSSGWAGLAGVTAGLVGLAAVLGLKRRRDHNDEKSSVTDISYDYYTDYTSASSESSDRRTRDTRRSSRR